MTVDGVYSEPWFLTGNFSLLSSSRVFVGGSEAPHKLPGGSAKAGALSNFVGCLRKVEFKADSLVLPMIKFAKEGNNLISTSSGRIEFGYVYTLPRLIS